MARIDAFLKLGLAQGCSDIHLAVGVPPMLRLHGDLMPIKFRDLGDTELEGYVDEILSANQKERFRKRQRPRLLLREQRRRPLPRERVPQGDRRRRHVPDHPGRGPDARKPRPAAGRSPSSATYHQGMVLVTGSTGTGKSTTLAAMIDHLNTTSNCNIISLEDPDRVRAQQQALAGHAARARHAHPELRRRRARERCARIPT